MKCLRFDITTALLWTTLGLAVLTALVGVPQALHAQPVDEAKAAKVKAAYLVNFMRFTQWPRSAFASSDSPVMLTVLGEDPLGRVLDGTVRGVTLDERSVEVQRLSWPVPDRYRTRDAYEAAREQTVQRLRESHMLLLSPEVLNHASEVLEALGDAPVLSVGDGEAFMRTGAMLGLELEKDRIVFHANATRIRRSSVTVSSRLLSLARLYEP